MARRSKGGAERSSGATDWPGVAAPSVLPEAGLYFWRVFGDGREELGGYHNFRHVWQMGRFLLEVLEGAEEIEAGPLPVLGGVEDERAGGILRYLIVTDRDPSGEAAKGRRFRAKLMGATFEEAIKLGKLHTDIQLPYSEDSWRRSAQGRPPRSFSAWESGEDGTSLARDTSGSGSPREERRARREAARERPAPTERRAATPRASRDGLVALTAICAEQGVEAGDVRAALRKLKVEKPTEGWAFKVDDPRLEMIKGVIASLKD